MRSVFVEDSNSNLNVSYEPLPLSPTLRSNNLYESVEETVSSCADDIDLSDESLDEYEFDSESSILSSEDQDEDEDQDFDLDFDLEDSSTYKTKIENARQSSDPVCLQLSAREINAMYEDSNAVQTYSKIFGLSGYKLEKLCGFSCESSFCTCGCMGASFPENLFLAQLGTTTGGITEETRYGLINQFYMPKGIPYSVVVTPNFGEVFTTPFFTVIPSLLTKVPKQMFRMANISLFKMMETPQFRHEYAFDDKVAVDIPEDTLEMFDNYRLWRQLAVELNSLKTHNVARAAVSTLPLFLMNLKGLLLTVVPPSLSIKIDSYLDPLLVVTKQYQQYAPELAMYLRSVLISIDHLKVSDLVAETLEILRNPLDVFNLVKGIRNTTILATKVKVITINENLGKIRSDLILGLPEYESNFFEEQISNGLVDGHAFKMWYDQVEIAEPIAEMLEADLKNVNFDAFLGKYLSFVLLRKWRSGGVPTVFSLDRTRIMRLRDQFDELVFNRFLNKVNELREGKTKDTMMNLIGSEKFYDLPIYELIEMREFESIIDRIVSGGGLKIPNTLFERLVQEITLAASIHWQAAEEHYKKL